MPKKLSASGIITVTTDFGASDHYVGAMKGAILSAFARSRIVDISHCVEPQSITQGAYMLSAAYSHFPPGTVHLAVVDPGVGGKRRAIAVETGRYWFVAPDNGVLSWALELERDYKARELSPPYDRELSATFHGRDVFAPAAARLAAGGAFESLGPPASRLAELKRCEAGPAPSVWRTRVVHIDGFGNLICGLRRTDLGSESEGPTIRDAKVEVAGRVLSGIGRTYAQAREGELFALFSSSGHLEVAISCGSAAAQTGAAVGAEVTLRLPVIAASAG